MDGIKDYFLCGVCHNKEFLRVYSFSFQFHGVNFSDELIYDRLTDEMYQCTKCTRLFTIKEIEERLAEIKKKHKKS